VFRRRKLVDEYREFSRELLLRSDRSTRELLQRLDRSTRELLQRLDRNEARREADFQARREESRAYFEESRAYHARENRRLDELLEDHREQRGALLAILDRLDNGGTAPAG
jgi:hypothetical protein